VRVPVLASGANFVCRLFAEASALLGIEEAVWTAFLGFAEALALNGIEVSKLGALLIFAAAVAGIRDELKSLLAGNGLALALTACLIPNFIINLAILNDAFRLTRGDVPSVIRISLNLGLADALAVPLIPYLISAVWMWRAI